MTSFQNKFPPISPNSTQIFPAKPTIITPPPLMINKNTFTGTSTSFTSPTGSISTSGITYLVHPTTPKNF